MEKKYAIEKYLTKAEVSKIKSLKEINTNPIRTVTEETVCGIYNFRGCPNVAIWDIRKEKIGVKKEVLFSFCLRYFDAEEGGIYYINSKTTQLRIKTETNNKKRKNRPGPNTFEEEKIYGAFASTEVIRKNSKK